MRSKSNWMADFAGKRHQKISVSVDGEELPLKIGDKVVLPESSRQLKTVVGIGVSDDARVVYTLEWFSQDEGAFQQQAVTWNELLMLRENCGSVEAIGFGLHDAEPAKAKKRRKKKKAEEEKTEE